MQRRKFIASAIVGVSGVYSIPALAAQPSLFTSPQSFLGATFFDEVGAAVRLASVDMLDADRRLNQFSLRFEGNSSLGEGIHTLRSQTGERVSLYLQPQGSSAIACVSRIA